MALNYTQLKSKNLKMFLLFFMSWSSRWFPLIPFPLIITSEENGNPQYYHKLSNPDCYLLQFSHMETLFYWIMSVVSTLSKLWYFYCCKSNVCGTNSSLNWAELGENLPPLQPTSSLQSVSHYLSQSPLLLCPASLLHVTFSLSLSLSIWMRPFCIWLNGKIDPGGHVCCWDWILQTWEQQELHAAKVNL